MPASGITLNNDGRMPRYVVKNPSDLKIFWIQSFVEIYYLWAPRLPFIYIFLLWLIFINILVNLIVSNGNVIVYAIIPEMDPRPIICKKNTNLSDEGC